MNESNKNLKNQVAFWQQYYAGAIHGDCELVDKPSPFAEWVRLRMEEDNPEDAHLSLLEVGCGNGRDAVYFARSGIKVIATDCCPQAVHLTTEKLPEGSRAEVACAGGLPNEFVDYAYARFVLHSMDESEQEYLLNWIKIHVRKSFYIETRSVHDPRCGKGTLVGANAFVDTHYRRFMSTTDLNVAASKALLQVVYCTEVPSGSGTDGAVVLRAELKP